MANPRKYSSLLVFRLPVFQPERLFRLLYIVLQLYDVGLVNALHVGAAPSSVPESLDICNIGMIMTRWTRHIGSWGVFCSFVYREKASWMTGYAVYSTGVYFTRAGKPRLQLLSLTSPLLLLPQLFTGPLFTALLLFTCPCRLLVPLSAAAGGSV